MCIVGAALARAFRECGARYSPYTSVWELSAVGRRADHEAPVELGLLRDGFAEMVYAHCVIAATGAQERTVPAPGATLPGVLVAGDGAHILGAEAAVDSGRIAALEAAHRLGRVDAQRRDALAKPHRASLARHRRFREFLDLAFEPGATALRPSDPAVTVCRCEEVTVAEIERVIAHGCPGPNQAKAFTRCGMGPCQGRMCATAVSEIFAEHQRTGVEKVGHYRIRPPVKPLTVGELAALEGTGTAPAEACSGMSRGF